MLAGADYHVEIAGRPALNARIALARQADALTIAGARLDAHFQWFGAFHYAFAAAGGADGNVLAGAVAAWALGVELHAPAGLRHLAGALAFWADTGRLQEAAPVTVCANIAASDLQAHDRSANRLPEPYVDLVLQV